MLTAELMWAPEILPKIRIAMVTAIPKTAEMINAESVNAIEPHPSPTINAVPKNSEKIVSTLSELMQAIFDIC